MRRQWCQHAAEGIGFPMSLNGFGDGYNYGTALSSLPGPELANDPAFEIAHPGRQALAIRIDQVKAIACIDRMLERLHQIALAQVVFHEPTPAEHNTKTIERGTEGQIGAGKSNAPCERE